MAKLHPSTPGLLLLVEGTQRMISLSKPITTIGRKGTDIVINDTKVSTLHAEVRMDATGVHVRDLDSTNGTYVNRAQVTEQRLADQDLIEIGSATLCFFADAHGFQGAVKTRVGEVQLEQEEESLEDPSDVLTTTKTLHLPQIHLQIMNGPDSGKSYTFQKSHITIGRNKTDLVLSDIDVSRQHAVIEVLSSRKIYIRDLQSTNGTLLKGHKIESQNLKSGDRIVLGSTELEFLLDEGKES